MKIIGIAGGTGSGKTTVVRKIAESLPEGSVSVITLDSYYTDASYLSEEEKRNCNVDHPDAFDWELLRQHIHSLKDGKGIDVPTYSYVEFARLPETIRIEPTPIVIVEGIMMLLDPELRSMMDLKIFVDTDADERLVRNIQRDVIERGRTLEMTIDRYMRMKKPMHEQFIEPTKKFADLIVPVGGDNKTGIHILKTYIERLLGN